MRLRGETDRQQVTEEINAIRKVIESLKHEANSYTKCFHPTQIFYFNSKL
jgi:hypothetical protein